ncbi:MAG: MBL fold metallo-hydrolase [Dehalococcoidia bacterium]|nr:MBL fold metallo-hydrolase [Dehalococcoidia bacterium]
MTTAHEHHVPASINPELKEHTKLFERKIHKVGDNVYCAVGYNLANIIMVEGKDGIVIVDTGMELKQGQDVLADFQKITSKPVTAIIYTHHHSDHVQGTGAFVSQQDAASGTVPIISHETLMQEYIHESGFIGPIMSARAISMYNSMLDGDDMKDMNAGIGPSFGPGKNVFIPPTQTFHDKLNITLAGIRMEMYYVPSEAHSELCIYLPDAKTLLSAEVIQDHCYPNIYTVRGAVYRNPTDWYRSIDAMRGFAAEAEHMVLQHGTPISGRDYIQQVLTYYRDAIQFTHDQTLRYSNKGYSKDEVAKLVKLPPHLENFSPWLRPFYGSVKHSVPQIVCGSIGWFDGDPCYLDPTPRIEYAKRLVALMGGRERILEEADKVFVNGDPQFSAELTSYLIRIDQNDMEARKLKAAAYRVLGYAAINATWRGFYLTGARILEGSLDLDPVYSLLGDFLISPDVLSLFPALNQVENMPVRLKAEETLDLTEAVGFRYTDTDEEYTLEIRRGVAEVRSGLPGNAVATVKGTRASMGPLLSGVTPITEALKSSEIQIDGSKEALVQFLGYFEMLYQKFPNYFLR